ncbi:type II secretion system protein N [Endozoicomonas sp. SESOKO1]|uniref:type II secretion system protein N n=1 Tax=Endozoicomonas sp. SESOKO1 TaxID=2828742 RepID=UPI002148F167|nr:type II secretion system protein N [Endozoicomonas sp. SESOKO1]
MMMKPVASTTFLQWGHKNNRILMLLIMFIVIILSISYQIFNLYQIVSREPLIERDHNKTIVSKSTSTIKPEDYELLFGFSDSQGITENNKEIPITKMNLILRGALSGFENKKYASAIIQIANQDKLYEIGDALPGGAILNQVYSDHIIIKRGSQLEKLYFPETARDSRAFQEFRAVEEDIPESMEPRPGNHDYPDDMSLEQRMQDLREKLQEASQEL